MTQTVLHIDASARTQGSISRELSAEVVSKIGGDVTRRDLANGLPLIDEVWVGANFTPEDARTDAQRETLALSDTLIQELRDADTLVIGTPIYNFGIPSGLKAWIDLISRAGVTFRYTEEGPEGLMTGKRAIVVIATGGTPIGSEIDFASGYIRHILSFIGITDVEIIAADLIMAQSETAVANARAKIDKLAA